ncbi:hypothetical protein H0H93_010011 [Arthromyces matolae]|nr:hypothetical protein H0H93_010011 [Arthromyces matolae]
MSETLADYIESQDELLKEAALALPHEFSRCTYSLGYIRPYDAKTEQETMIQCLICEDWFHESCCNLRERPPPRSSSMEPAPEGTDKKEDCEDETRSECSTDLPSGLITGSEYESFICGSCVSKNKTLVKWAGTPGITMVVRNTIAGPWERLGDYSPSFEERVSVDDAGDEDKLTSGCKRPLSPSNIEGSDAKRLRGNDASISSITPCLAPYSNSVAQRVYEQLCAPATESLGTGDLFLSEGFRTRWCRCSSCLPPLEATPCLLKEEETYEPPEDPDSGLSLEELGMRALERMPRDKAIDGIHAFNGMRDNLVKYLRPFAQEGKVVGESDIKQFFDSLTETAKTQNRG